MLLVELDSFLVGYPILIFPANVHRQVTLHYIDWTGCVYIFRKICVQQIWDQLMKNLQAVNSKERKEGCVRGFGGSKRGKWYIIYL